MTIRYKSSLYPSKYVARHKTPDKNQEYPEIVMYIPSIAQYGDIDFEDKDGFNYFLNLYVYFLIQERACLAARLNNKERVKRGLSKKRIMGRCKEYKGYYCKLEYIAHQIWLGLI